MKLLFHCPKCFHFLQLYSIIQECGPLNRGARCLCEKIFEQPKLPIVGIFRVQNSIFLYLNLPNVNFKLRGKCTSGLSCLINIDKRRSSTPAGVVVKLITVVADIREGGSCSSFNFVVRYSLSYY